MTITIIAAVAENRVIGTSDGIPWHLPKDIAHFRNYTSGKWMLLGRKTYSEMIGWFTNQTPIVISRRKDLSIVNKGYRVNSIEAAMELGRRNGIDELVISGGAKIYELALPFTDRMILTRVLKEIPNGTAYFPKFTGQDWQLAHQEDWPADDENAQSMRLEIYSRKSL